jgi:trehalose 6-phosphate phosphatase
MSYTPSRSSSSVQLPDASHVAAPRTESGGTGSGHSGPDPGAVIGGAGRSAKTGPGSRRARQAALPLINSRSALFLDFDGTLVDIAQQPDQVVIPDYMVELLSGLSAQLGGALAIVSGRKMTDLDKFLSPLRLPAAAEHGAEQRLPTGNLVHLAAPKLHPVIRVMLALASEHAGLRAEIKSSAAALHYRQAPALEELCLQTLAEAVKLTPGVELLHGKCVLEVKPAGISKGTAMEMFMLYPPFAGRQPVFAGDDTTDEAGFAAMLTLGGQGVKIGQGATLARHRCKSPELLRQWLQHSLQALSEAALKHTEGRQT